MSQIKLRMTSGEDGTIFAEDCSFSAAIGRLVPLRMFGLPKGEGKLIAARVIEDGWAVELTVDIADELIEEFGLTSSPVPFNERFRFREASPTPSFADAIPGVDTVTSVAIALQETRNQLRAARYLLQEAMDYVGNEALCNDIEAFLRVTSDDI